jgi:hypothetical protein
MLMAIIGVAFVSPLLIALAMNNAFGYDEAVYAQLTRHWIGDTPSSGWAIHRPPGLSILGIPAQLVGAGAEWTYRLVGVIFGIGLVVAAWRWARAAGGVRAGILAAAALVNAAPLQVESATFLNDVPAACLMLIMAALLWREVSRTEPLTSSFVLLAILGAAAFYLRYGAIVTIVGLAVAALVIAHGKLRSSWGVAAVTAALFGLLLVPHLVIATAVTGAPWGILASAQRAAGEGTTLPILEYAAWFPWRLVGPFGALVALGGIATAVLAWFPEREAGGSSRRLARYVGIAVLVQAAVLGTVIHAEPRYALSTMSMLVVLGAVQAGHALEIDTTRAGLRPVVAGLCVLALALGAALSVGEVIGRAGAWDWKRDVGREIGADVTAAGSPACSVLTSDVPIMSWYSRCDAVSFLTGGEPETPSVASGTRQYAVVRTDGHNQPPVPVIDEMVVAQADRWRTYTDGAGAPAATVYRMRRSRPARDDVLGRSCCQQVLSEPGHQRRLFVHDVRLDRQVGLKEADEHRVQLLAAIAPRRIHQPLRDARVASR